MTPAWKTQRHKQAKEEALQDKRQQVKEEVIQERTYEREVDRYESV